MKKGFTLVELLAVIAILAILVIIALPNVMGMFNTAKENSFKTEVKEIYKVAQNQWMQDSMFKTDEKVYSRCNGCTNGLDLSGRSELHYYIKLNKSGKVVEYYATDGTFQYSFSDPDGLKVEDIKNVQKVADITDPSDVIKITPTGANGGDSGPYTGSIYRIYEKNYHNIGIGSSIESMNRIKDIQKWCNYETSDGIEYSSCNINQPGYDIEDNIGYDSESECITGSTRWCYIANDGSFNSCTKATEAYGFGNESSCQTALNDSINSGWATAGQYRCESAVLGTCRLGNMKAGDYSTTSSIFNTKGYVKHDVVNNIITESYVCFITDREVCLNARLEKYEENKQALLSQQTWFNNHSGSCRTNSYETRCSNNDMEIYVSGQEMGDIALHQEVNGDGILRYYNFCVSHNGKFVCGG